LIKAQGTVAKISIKGEVTALKRERTIEAAAQLFYDRGYEQTTLEMVADDLGVTKPFIYAYFKSKADLLADICVRGIGTSLAALDAALALDATPTEKLRIVSRDFVMAVLQNQKHIAVLTREEKNLSPEDFQRLSGLRREFDAKLTALLVSGVEAGEFHIADPNIAALAIGGLVSWAYVWYRPYGRLQMEGIADEISALILSMAGVSPEDVVANSRVPA
jgi:TetR/AcrR family transcriptional regulator, cholesterol catabolism regulator